MRWRWDWVRYGGPFMGSTERDETALFLFAVLLNFYAMQ
jgi:hypothetical protein